ncbi:hypothetical protein BGW38_007191 [Lunasporangiospora selenospora]|uniref:Uncharacterized protein n=1 Tax=Lunasporangiospora selenospora TaxID=979761 RepID=A0A9P6G3Q4_9FUNG|nr:hypothetical protein BGW38_007191 [Lunasporangiospora selenospora]
MLENAIGKLAVYMEQTNVSAKQSSTCRLLDLPSVLRSVFEDAKAQQPTACPSPLSSKPAPGQAVGPEERPSVEHVPTKSVDSLCLGLRKAYIEHLYQDDYSVGDYVKKLNAASKEMTALAAAQSIPLKEAQQKLAAFIIEFLRIWPSKMTSKYRQLGRELNIGRSTDSKSQDHYVILDDERPELDKWKVYALKRLKDTEVRMYLRKLKTKDAQIQIVQNLHILLLIDKYDLEENKPFKKDPGALKTIVHFMDELCIASSIEDRPTVGLTSPQTPRSKDMDPAKKFYIRVIARYYAPSLPKITDALSIKCGVKTNLLTSPRGPRRVEMKRTVSMGVLQKPKPLSFGGAMDEPETSKVATVQSNPTKRGAAMSRTTSSDNARNVLNSSIFKNRQVAMTISSVKGLDFVPQPIFSGTGSSSSTAHSSVPRLSASQPLPSVSAPPMTPSAVMSIQEEEEPVPKMARLKQKRAHYDLNEDEILKVKNKAPDEEK